MGMEPNKKKKTNKSAASLKPKDYGFRAFFQRIITHHHFGVKLHRFQCCSPPLKLSDYCLLKFSAYIEEFFSMHFVSRCAELFVSSLRWELVKVFMLWDTFISAFETPRKVMYKFVLMQAALIPKPFLQHFNISLSG